MHYQVKQSIGVVIQWHMLGMYAPTLCAIVLIKRYGVQRLTLPN
ncbi:MAG: hypothetical protein RLZZ293_1326 [Pseudomonadota bacterium]|jgi:hypothetical protein